MDEAPWQLVVPSEEAEIRVPCSLVSAPALASAAESQVPSGGGAGWAGLQDSARSGPPGGLISTRVATTLRAQWAWGPAETRVGSEIQPFLRTVGDLVEKWS